MENLKRNRLKSVVLAAAFLLVPASCSPQYSGSGAAGDAAGPPSSLGDIDFVEIDLPGSPGEKVNAFPSSSDFEAAINSVETTGTYLANGRVECSSELYDLRNAPDQTPSSRLDCYFGFFVLDTSVGLTQSLPANFVRLTEAMRVQSFGGVGFDFEVLFPSASDAVNSSNTPGFVGVSYEFDRAYLGQNANVKLTVTPPASFSIPAFVIFDEPFFVGCTPELDARYPFGSSTPTDQVPSGPVLLCTKEHVANISSNEVFGGKTPAQRMDLDYVVGGDIDFAGAEFPRIYHESNPVFSGSFDGGGHTFFNIDLPYKGAAVHGDNHGVFPSVKEATISNLNLSGVTLRLDGADKPVASGGLVGDLRGSNISNIEIIIDKASGSRIYLGGGFGTIGNHLPSTSITNVFVRGLDANSIIDGASHVGGFAAQVGGLVTVSNSSVNNIKVRGSDSIGVGGFVGRYVVDQAQISKSYVGNGVHVEADRYIGGFVGNTDNLNSSIIFDSYSLASVSNTDASVDEVYLGGFAGFAGFGRPTGYFITNSYSTGLVSCIGPCDGVGPFSGIGHVENSFWSLDSSGTGFNGPTGQGLTTAQFTTDADNDGVIDAFDANNANWDPAIWELDPAKTSTGFPELK